MKLTARAALLLLIAPQVLAAQLSRPTVASVADVALSQGRLDDAEAALFAASSRAPRDPAARGALGWYLASRGKLRVGATLLEEARQFGGDPSAINPRLATIYAWLGEWSAVLALPSLPRSIDRDVATWLASHPPNSFGPESSVVALEANDLRGFGRIKIRIGRTLVETVDVDPTVSGLVLPLTAEVTAASELFGMRDTMTVGVVRELEIGQIKFTNVCASFGNSARAAIGLDVLASLQPTFDEGRSLTLRTSPVAQSGTPIPIILGFPGVKIVPRAGTPPVAIESPAGRAALRGTLWTFDLKHGAIFTQPR